VWGVGYPVLGGQALAALGAAVGQDAATAHGRAAAAEPVPPLADELAGLIRAFHGGDSVGQNKFEREGRVYTGAPRPCQRRADVHGFAAALLAGKS